MKPCLVSLLVIILTSSGLQTDGIPNTFAKGSLLKLEQTCEADVIVVFDATGILDEEYFLISKDFVSSLAILFTLHPASPRVSIMTYREYYSTIVPLPANATAEQLEAAMNAIPYFPGGGRRTDAALDGVVVEFTVHSSPRNASRTMFLMTNAVSDEPVKTLVAAEKVRDAGIAGVVLGATDQVDPDELLAIAGGNPDHVVGANFEAIFDLLAKLMCP